VTSTEHVQSTRFKAMTKTWLNCWPQSTRLSYVEPIYSGDTYVTFFVCVCDRIYVHSAVADWRQCIHTTRLPDAVVDIV